MFFIGTDIQGVLIVACLLILIPLTARFINSGIPRLRVIVLSGISLLIWFCCFILTLTGDSQNISMLWEILSFMGMAATLFILFIGVYEILSSPGMSNW